MVDSGVPDDGLSDAPLEEEAHQRRIDECNCCLDEIHHPRGVYYLDVVLLVSWNTSLTNNLEESVMAHEENREQDADQGEDLGAPEHGKVLIKSCLVRYEFIEHTQLWDKANNQCEKHKDKYVCGD